MKKRIKKEKKPTFPVREVDRQLHAACSELNIGRHYALIAGVRSAMNGNLRHNRTTVKIPSGKRSRESAIRV